MFNFALTGVSGYVAPRHLNASRDKGSHYHPFYLAWKARESGQPTRFIELAGEINTQMPAYVVDKLAQALNEHGKSVKGSKVLILGLAYKPNIDDPRESPAFEIVNLLINQGSTVSYFDPWIPIAPRMRTWPELPLMESVTLSRECLQFSDAVVLITDHKDVDYELVRRHSSLIVDTRGVFRNGSVNVTMS